MHTEESLMALADRYGCETALDYNSRKASEAFADLRLAIREVLAERSAMIDNVRFARERAERAEAEVQRRTPTAEDRKAAQWLADDFDRIGQTRVSELLRRYVLREE